MLVMHGTLVCDRRLLVADNGRIVPKMDPLTWLSLGLQLAALCSIVGALLLYLLRKVRVAEVQPLESAKTVLVTSVDSALGLQVTAAFYHPAP